VDLYYRLNCDATSVTISVYPAGQPTNPIRTETVEVSPYIDAGIQVYEWDCRDDSTALVAAGSYGFSVQAWHTGFSAWENVTDPDTVPYPYDLGGGYVSAEWGTYATMEPVKDPQSPAFGRIMVLTANDSVAGSHSDVVTSAGIWMVNADFSEEDPAAAPNVNGDHDTARAEMNASIPYPWGQSTATYYPTYGPQNATERFDGVEGWVVNNGSNDGHTVYACDVDGSAASLIYPLTPDSVAPHGEPQWAALIGEGTDRVLYVSDWSYNGPGLRGVETGSYQDVWAYEVGTVDNDFDTTPKCALASSYISNMQASICRDADILPDIGKVYFSNQRWSAPAYKAYLMAVLDKDAATTDSADGQVVWSKIGSEWRTDSGCISGYMSGQAVAKDASMYVQQSNIGLTGWPGTKYALGYAAPHAMGAGTYEFEINLGTTAPSGTERWDGIALYNDGDEAGEPGEGIAIALRDNAGAQGLNMVSYHPPAWIVGGANFAWTANTWYKVKFEIANVTATTVDVSAKIWKLGDAEPGAWLWSQAAVPAGDTTKQGVLLLAAEGTSGSGDWGISRFDNVVHFGFEDGSYQGWTANGGDWDIAGAGKSDVVYGGGRYGYFVAYDTITGVIIPGSDVQADTGDYYYAALGVDAAGNLLSGTYRWKEAVMFSPPGENSFTTFLGDRDGNDSFAFNYRTSVDDWYMF
jgi:hypothetical protein